MQCPKCHGPMEKVTFQAIEVDRCTVCGGIWFDALEHERLRTLHGASKLDVGSARVGRHMDEHREVSCPKCGVPMTSLADHRQHHIWVEHCPKCSGAYFDAGEFRDFAHEELGDFFKWLFPVKLRKPLEENP